MMTIREELDKLYETDIYSLLSFVLFKARGESQIAPFSELVYILPMGNMLKLCEYFGGQTIYVPKIDEFEELVYALLMYQFVNVDNRDKDEVIAEIKEKVSYARVEPLYDKLCEVLRDYKFSPRGE